MTFTFASKNIVIAVLAMLYGCEQSNTSTWAIDGKSVDVEKVTVLRGSICEGQAALGFQLQELPEPLFYVHIDPKTGGKKLDRPM